MSSKMIVAGIAAGAAVVVAGVLYVLSRPAPVPSKAASGKDSAKQPKIDKTKIIKIFERITAMMQVVVMNLADHEQKVRQTAAQRGKQITNAEMEQYLMVQFRQAMGEVEKTVYMEHQTSEEEVRAATQFYQDDEDFKKTLTKLKTLFKAVTGQPQDELPEVPDHITMEKTLQVMSEIMEGINIAVEEIHEELQGKGLSPESHEFKVELQNRYLEGVGVLRKEVHERHSLTEDILHAAVLKYQQNERFQQSLMEISNAHRSRLEKVGFQQQ